jgi:hypothetical protein
MLRRLPLITGNGLQDNFVPEVLYDHHYENLRSYINELLSFMKCWEHFGVAGELIFSQQGFSSLELDS